MSNLARETSNFSMTIPCFVIACVVYIGFGESENKGPSNVSEITGTELGIIEREEWHSSSSKGRRELYAGVSVWLLIAIN